MKIEKTFVMLKPDCLQRGLAGEVLSRIEKKGFRISEAKTAKLDKDFLFAHYAHLVDKLFFPEVVELMQSGPVLGMIICGENAVSGMRKMAGATKIEDALPGTVRGDFALSTENNLIHCAESKEIAKTEIERFFGAKVES